MTITTFVDQNIGARKCKRAKKGIWAAWAMRSLVILVGSICMYLFVSLLVSISTDDVQVIANGSGMLRMFSAACIILPVIQILSGALRRAGLSEILMFFVLGCLVVLKQIYLMTTVPMTYNMFVVLTGWPVTWVTCAIGMLIYYVKADWLPRETEKQGR